MQLDHCVIHVTDWEQSNAFYRDVLGMEVVPIGNGWVYRFGGMQLNVHGPGVEPDPVARVPVPPGGSDLCFV
jgi:catechol 2,3-dioxygenase-like lactoylglutathione lyase family enzyme